MARTKGMLNLSGNLEVNAGAPLDARSVVPTVADLTVASNFQYKYVGMTVVVQATGDMYILTANDVTVAANWKQVGSGGGGSSYTAGDGIVIEDDEISTDNMPAADMAEIVTPLPSVMSRLPILFDETGAEQVVGWYRYSDGTKKPVYKKSFIATTSVSGSFSLGVNIDKLVSAEGVCYSSATLQIPLGYNDTSTAFGAYLYPDHSTMTFGVGGSAVINKPCYITLQYTKTTDTPV